MQKATRVVPPADWQAQAHAAMHLDVVARSPHPRPYDDPTADEALANIAAVDEFARQLADVPLTLPAMLATA